MISSHELVVVGGDGRQLRVLHPQIGSTASKLARKLQTHFLVTRATPKESGKILFCTGANVSMNKTLQLGGEWISKTVAQVGLFHAIQSSKHISNIRGDQKQTPDLYIDQASKQLRDVGVKNGNIPRIWYGLVVEEVLIKLSEKGYELLAVGSHFQPEQDRCQGTIMDDVTDQSLNRSNYSVLLV